MKNRKIYIYIKTCVKSKICEKDTWLKGSYTVEAAAVFSLVMFVMTAFLFCAFYMHDKGVMQGAVCEIAAAGSNFAKEKEKKEAVSEAKSYINADRFMGSKTIRKSAAVGKKETTASGSAVFPVPGFVMKYLTDNQLSIEKEWTSRSFDPAHTIRLVRGAEKIFQAEKE